MAKKKNFLGGTKEFKLTTNPKANKMTPKEKREQIIKQRAERLARDAKKAGVTPEQLLKKRRDTYVNVVGGAALGALPIGAILRIANTAFKGLTGAKAAATGARVASKTKPPVATSAKKAPAKKADKPASQQVIEGKATVKSSSKPGTAVVPAGSRAVKKPGTGVQQVRQVKDKKPPMKNVTPKKKALPNKTKPAAKKKSSAVQKAALGTAALAAVTGMIDRAKDKKAGADTKKSVPVPKPRPPKQGPMPAPKKKKASPGGVNKGADAPKRQKPSGGPTQRGRNRPKSALPTGALRVFQGTYDKKTEGLRNITVDGVKKTYVVRKKK